jgi:hypothetical protein
MCFISAFTSLISFSRFLRIKWTCLRRALASGYIRETVGDREFVDANCGLINMKRLKQSGASVSSALLGLTQLKFVLDELGVGDKFDEAAVDQVHLKIAAVIGLWHAELEAKDASPTAKAFLSTGRNLEEASTLLSGRQTGIRSSVEIYATNEMIRILALDPTIRDAAGAVDAFRETAAKIAHACMVAYVELKEKGDDGRPRLGWHDDFTKVLIELAERGGVKPSIGRDRVTGERTGWLLEAAQALEFFLEPHMRSNSVEACASRLERSKRRLSSRKRQNPPRG